MAGNLNNAECQCSKHGFGADIVAVKLIDYFQVGRGCWNSIARHVTVFLLR
jgi:hypothetical protein